MYDKTDLHTHPFNGPLSGTTQVSRYQKVKPIWILLELKIDLVKTTTTTTQQPFNGLFSRTTWVSR